MYRVYVNYKYIKSIWKSHTFSGSHEVSIDYAGIPIPGSPFYVDAHDVTKVKVEGIEDGIVGKRSSFTGGKYLFFKIDIFSVFLNPYVDYWLG